MVSFVSTPTDYNLFLLDSVELLPDLRNCLILLEQLLLKLYDFRLEFCFLSKFILCCLLQPHLLLIDLLQEVNVLLRYLVELPL